MEPIQIIGIDSLDEQEQELATTLINSYFKKIILIIKKVDSLIVHIKAHTKGGKRKKYDIRVRVLAPTRMFETQESDWDLARTLHKVLKNMEREIEHKLASKKE
jgi:hypothetical protein